MATISCWVRRGAVFSLLALPVVAAAGWPLGSLIDESVLVDVTEEGFLSLQDVVETFVPAEFALPDVNLYDESCTNPCGIFGGSCEICAFTADIDLTDLLVVPTVDTLALSPAEGVLNLDGSLIVQLNSAASPATLSYEVTGLGIPISDTCDVYTNPITVTFDGSLALSTAPDPLGVDVNGDGIADTKLLDATIPPLGWDWDADDTDIQLVGCGTGTVIDVLNDALDLFGFDNIYDLVLDQIEPNGPDAPAGQVEALVDSLPATIEPLVEDTFSALFLSETVDLLGVALTLTVWPDAVETHVDGMRIALTSVTDVEPDPCMAAWDTGESLVTPSFAPDLGESPPGLSFTPHAALAVDDDFVNQLLYGAWVGGLFCVTVSEDNDPFGLPIAMNSALLALLAPEVFTDLFPEVQPLEISTEPRNAPVVGAPAAHDLRVIDEGLGLNFVTVVEGRETRLLGIDLVVDVGADLTFDGATGVLGAVVDLGTGALTPHVTYNEFRPDAGEAIEGSFGSLIDSIVLPLVAPYLEGLSFPLPALEGFGVTALELAPAGSNGDYIGAYVSTGPVTYSSTGCTTDGSGCDTSSCSSGCSTGSGAVWLGLPLIVAALRRNVSSRWTGRRNVSSRTA